MYIDCQNQKKSTAVTVGASPSISTRNLVKIMIDEL